MTQGWQKAQGCRQACRVRFQQRGRADHGEKEWNKTHMSCLYNPQPTMLKVGTGPAPPLINYYHPIHSSLSTEPSSLHSKWTNLTWPEHPGPPEKHKWTYLNDIIILFNIRFYVGLPVIQRMTGALVLPLRGSKDQWKRRAEELLRLNCGMLTISFLVNKDTSSVLLLSLFANNARHSDGSGKSHRKKCQNGNKYCTSHRCQY